MNRKIVFWWFSVILIVLTMILAFENILTYQTYYVLFFQVELSSTLLIFLSAILGFMIAFFFMLYSFEVRQEKESLDQEDAVASAPAKKVESKPVETASAKPDEFEEDDEVLG